jgi:hypothetical protein
LRDPIPEKRRELCVGDQSPRLCQRLLRVGDLGLRSLLRADHPLRPRLVRVSCII